MSHYKPIITATLSLLLTLSSAHAAPPPRPGNDNPPPPPDGQIRRDSIAELGRRIFFDTGLSFPAGQACATCHAPNAAFSDPRPGPTSAGAVSGRFGSRNAPTAGYLAQVPALHFDSTLGLFFGGLFRDGRADSLEEQAKVPFFNPLEMNNPDVESLVESLRTADYAPAFDQVFGPGALDDPDTALDLAAMALAAFERNPELSPLQSKFDAVQAGQESFSAAEQRGFDLFFGRAGCSVCHSTPETDENGTPQTQIFSSLAYANIGVPRNPNNPFYTQDPSLNPDGADFVDLGLGAVVGAAEQNGKFRIPTLRNVALTAPYMHNGVFRNLREVIRFYNLRDLDPDIAPPEVAENVTTFGGIGDLGLNRHDVDDLIAFLQTLSDRGP